MLVHKCLLGQTDIEISPIGLGTVKFGRNTDVKYPHQFNLPDDPTISNLLSFAQDIGINLLDTAPAYGNSEERIGKLLVGKRQDWVICTKVGEVYRDQSSIFNFNKSFIFESVVNSLKQLRTDYIDVVLVHSDGNDLAIIEKYEVFESLQQLKDQGYIRAYGMSTKTVEGGLQTVQFADVVMVSYNPMSTQERVVIKAAADNHKGVLIKKGLMSGHINRIESADPIQKTMDFIFTEPGVSSLIIGTLSQSHLAYDFKCALRAIVGRADNSLV